jgi:hypothetical protein
MSHRDKNVTGKNASSNLKVSKKKYFIAEGVVSRNFPIK